MKWLLFILSGIFLVGSDAMGEDWKLFSESEGSSFFFDAQTVACPSDNITRVSVKMVVSEKDRSVWVGRGGEKYLNLSYIKSFLEIDCKEIRERSLSLELFSEQETLDFFKGKESQWRSIPPGSNWDNLHKAICQ